MSIFPKTRPTIFCVRIVMSISHINIILTRQNKCNFWCCSVLQWDDVLQQRHRCRKHWWDHWLRAKKVLLQSDQTSWCGNDGRGKYDMFEYNFRPSLLSTLCIDGTRCYGNDVGAENIAETVGFISIKLLPKWKIWTTVPTHLHQTSSIKIWITVLIHLHQTLLIIIFFLSYFVLSIRFLYSNETRIFHVITASLLTISSNSLHFLQSFMSAFHSITVTLTQPLAALQVGAIGMAWLTCWNETSYLHCFLVICILQGLMATHKGVHKHPVPFPVGASKSAKMALHRYLEVEPNLTASALQKGNDIRWPIHVTDTKFSSPDYLQRERKEIYKFTTGHDKTYNSLDTTLEFFRQLHQKHPNILLSIHIC